MLQVNDRTLSELEGKKGSLFYRRLDYIHVVRHARYLGRIKQSIYTDLLRKLGLTEGALGWVNRRFIERSQNAGIECM